MCTNCHTLPPPLPAQYLDMIDDVMRSGVLRGDRTGTGTISKFGTTMRFNLRHTFPLLTSKRVFWRGGCGAVYACLLGSTSKPPGRACKSPGGGAPRAAVPAWAQCAGLQVTPLLHAAVRSCRPPPPAPVGTGILGKRCLPLSPLPMQAWRRSCCGL